MAEPVLYSFRRCPYAMRARMALRIGGASYEHREVVLRDKPAEMLEVSPKGTVPVLVAGPGEVIEESRDIMRWARAVVRELRSGCMCSACVLYLLAARSGCDDDEPAYMAVPNLINQVCVRVCVRVCVCVLPACMRACV